MTTAVNDFENHSLSTGLYGQYDPDPDHPLEYTTNMYDDYYDYYDEDDGYADDTVITLDPVGADDSEYQQWLNGGDVSLDDPADFWGITDDDWDNIWDDINTPDEVPGSDESPTVTPTTNPPIKPVTNANTKPTSSGGSSGGGSPSGSSSSKSPAQSLTQSANDIAKLIKSVTDLFKPATTTPTAVAPNSNVVSQVTTSTVAMVALGAVGAIGIYFLARKK